MATRKRVPPTPGAQIDEMWKLRQEKRALDKEVEAIAAKIAEKEAELLESLKANGLDKATGKHASVSISSSVSANVEDWDVFLAWIYKTKNGHLLQRRVADPAWREMSEIKGVVPGTQPFTKTRLNLRVLPS